MNSEYSKYYDANYAENGIHRVPLWRIAGFALNNLATNCYMFVMMYVAYYLTGFVGVGVVLAGSFSTIMRVWDGITDPICGLLVDKTNGRWGKNRPFMLLGNLILLVCSYILFHVTHKLPEGTIRVVFFTVVSLIYYIGYTFQCIVTKSAQSCLTNDPKQRPLFSVFDSLFSMGMYVGFGMWIPKLAAKYGTMVSTDLYHDLWLVAALISLVSTIIAIFSIAPKDRSEFFGTGEETPRVTLKDYWDTFKNNKAIQMLVLAASTDKLANSAKVGAVTVVMFAIVAGNYNISSTMSGITGILGLVIGVIFIVAIAPKFGQKKAMVVGSVGGLIINAILALLWIFGNPASMNGGDAGVHWGYFAILYVVLTLLSSGFLALSGQLVIPMTADCADYEVYRTGKYVPGMMGTLFSFVDKLISSLAPLIASLLFAMIGFKESMPDVNTAYTPALHGVGVFLTYGLVIIGLICNLIAMKYYPLDKEMMEEIREKIHDIKMGKTNN